MSDPLLDAIYFDGQSSQPYPAKIVVLSTALQLIIQLPDGNFQTLCWEHDRIHPTQIAGSRKVGLKYGEYPHQYLETDGRTFYATVKQVLPTAPYLRRVGNFFMSRGYVWVLGGLGTVLALLAAGYWLLLPLLARTAVSLIPVSTEVELGRKMAEEVLSHEKVDSARSEAINRFYRQLRVNTRYPIRVSVVKSSTVNAFAMPGGQIVVYSALLDRLEKYPELVALLGHETGHIEERHSLHMLTKQMMLHLLAATVLGDAGGISGVLLSNASQVAQLSHSRALEKEADRFGLNLLLSNQVDPSGMRDLLRRLKTEEKTLAPEFMLTHPTSDQRVADLKAALRHQTVRVVPHDSLTFYWKQLRKP